MTRALILALALTGCIGPEARVNISSEGGGSVHEMRADLKACLDEGLAFEFIPDFGKTAEFHRMKCMRQRGWRAGTDRGIGIPDFYRDPARRAPTWSAGE